jgi:hypothetical protein
MRQHAELALSVVQRDDRCSEELLLNLAQAVRASQELGAVRVVGTQRIVVEVRAQTIRILIQCRWRQRWVIPEMDSSIRYLNGVFREVDGSWIVATGNLAALDSVVSCLPAAYQHLLTPYSDDWHALQTRYPGDLSPRAR